MLLIDRGDIIAMGTKQELATSTNARVRQFLDRVPEPQVEDELNYLQMLTGDREARS
jgi:phospholipid/cholesterol/gamma-HCH transport system ATP-binding protein